MIGYSAGYGTHLPVLIQVMELSKGRVAEFGAGLCSTPYLHWKTYIQQQRKLVTFENNLEYFKLFDRYETEWHKLISVIDWDTIDLSGEWSVALIDHKPKGRRIEEIKRLENNCDYIIVHDTQGSRENEFHYRDTLAGFKYRKDFTLVRPHTCVVSNLVNLDHLVI
jgi:hypothetical protein